MGERFVLLAGIGTLVLMGLGLARVFQLRFELGDSYPESSTYRADPKGSKAYFEALASLPSLAVERNVLPLNMIESSMGDAAVFFLGSEVPHPRDWPVEQAMIEEIEAMATEGARVVATLKMAADPTVLRNGSWDIDDSADSEVGKPDSGAPDDSDDTDAPDAAEEETVDLFERWGFALGEADGSARPDGGWAVQGLGELADVPLPKWVDAWRLVGGDAAWQPLATIDGHPIVIERDWGRGKLVLMAGSYAVSNQALMHGESTGLLAWLPGGRSRIVFDETHLGSVASPGVMALVARYRLHGFFVGVALLVVVYAWKNSRGLVPPDSAGEGRLYADATVMGSGASDGLTQLLRRNLPPGALLETCYRTWFASGARSRRFTQARADEVIATIEAGRSQKAKEHEVVDAYNQVVDILAKRSDGGGDERG